MNNPVETMQRTLVTQDEAKDEFQQRFQRALLRCIAKRFSMEECFGLIWEETLQDIPLPEDAHREVYERMISWAKSIQELDPYRMPAGPDLDAVIHCHIIGHSPQQVPPCYSTDEREADKLRKIMEANYGVALMYGRTGIVEKAWFARYEIDPGNPTEVLAETYPLAICRLTLLRARKT